jgi:hypothetical protein
MIPVIPDRLCWSSAIGLFIINFGMMDLLVLDFLESTLSPEEFLRVKERPFYDRVELIKQRVSQADCSAETRERFEKFFRRLDPIRELRNHIAHGILRIELAQDQKPRILTLSLPKNLDGTNAPNALHLKFEELTKALGELTALTEELQNLPWLPE